jgi:hypothetical protein
MKAKVRARTTSSTQEHLELREVVDDLVISKGGVVSIVIQTTAVNFDLLSEVEQDNKIYAFASLLNSLNFHLQILIRTKRIDIAKYIGYLESQSQREMTEGLKKQLLIYTQFVKNLIVENEVLDKKFYIVIPYTPGSLNLDKPLIPLLSGSKTDSSKNSMLDLERSVEQGKIFLYAKRDQILKLLGRMGLMGHQLNNNELIELFYDIYNPEN